MKRQVVTFQVGQQWLGVDILLVREINRQLECTPVQLAPTHFIGLSNLRGQVVTIIDLARRLHQHHRSEDGKCHDIVLKGEQELATLRVREKRPDLMTSNDLVGLRVDAIGDIVEVEAEQIEPVPANLAEIDAKYVSGIVSVSCGLVLLLDTKGVLDGQEGIRPQ